MGNEVNTQTLTITLNNAEDLTPSWTRIADIVTKDKNR